MISGLTGTTASKLDPFLLTLNANVRPLFLYPSLVIHRRRGVNETPAVPARHYKVRIDVYSVGLFNK